MEPILNIGDDGPLHGSINDWRAWRAKTEKLGKDRDADVDYQRQLGDSVIALLQMLELQLCKAPPLAALEARRAELYQGGQKRLSQPVSHEEVGQ